MGDIDMSLDEIILRKRGVQGSRRGRPIGRARRGRVYRNFEDDRVNSYNRSTGAGQWQHDLYEDDELDDGIRARPLGQTTRLGINAGSNKLLVSNLEFGVSDSDLKELFGDFGPIRRLTVHYDRSGRSCGTAEITFQFADDAGSAIKQYNGILLDGRPMVIQRLPPGGFGRMAGSTEGPSLRFSLQGNRLTRTMGRMAIDSYGPMCQFRRPVASTSSQRFSDRGLGVRRIGTRRMRDGQPGFRISTSELDYQLERYNRDCGVEQKGTMEIITIGKKASPVSAIVEGGGLTVGTLPL